MKLSPWRRPSTMERADPRRAPFTWGRTRPAGCLDETGATEFQRAGRRARKRLFDALVIWCLSPFILLALAATAAAICATTGRPILFRQDRIGLNGRVFRMWKFRTMATNQPGGEVTLIEDDRVTPVGRILRPFHLDELPQVWNVIAGDMSLVGPRPEQPSLARRYSLDSPEFELRLLVMPGITGWAQVCGSYAGDLPETMIKLSHDLYYIEHQTVIFDLWILVRTMTVIAAGGGR
jgi:lipopolysaccharide/colanic/teichoic acid biosynthesis glycosyltransferase